MATYKTPGIYIEEISKFPPSVAEVETAIPAFIGYTKKAARKGASLKLVPTRVFSFLEFQQLFGDEQPIDSVEKIIVDASNNYAVDKVKLVKRFYLFDALRMFFDNGGGKCYIVSVGSYDDDIATGNDTSGLQGGLKTLEKVDEPTILLFPDAVSLDADEFYSLQLKALAQCARLQDRVAVFDLKEEDEGRGSSTAVTEFREKIGINDLKYGAAYTPWLRSSYPREVDLPVFDGKVVDKDNNSVDLREVSEDPDVNKQVRATLDAWADAKSIQGDLAARTIADAYAKAKTNILRAPEADDPRPLFVAALTEVRKSVEQLVTAKEKLRNADLRRDVETSAKSLLRPSLTDLIALEKNPSVLPLSDLADANAVNDKYTAIIKSNTEWLTGAVSEIVPDEPLAGAGADAREVIGVALRHLDQIVLGSASITAFIGAVEAASRARAGVTQKALYRDHATISNIVEAIKRKLAELPPSGAVAGAYAKVDRTRGVWKAPANVSLASVSEPVEAIDFYEQEELNVDVTGGKSINAIRAFTGLGTLVWGARTLAGNDNEWRYISVRRFFNMVEESIKKSTGWAVFEPNDANLWMRVKGMIDNYLVQKWRDGALVGATSDEAFYVLVGLGKTMTAQDVLEGKLIIEIGMAVVRPAEFIVLKFAHKMQES